MKGFSMKRLAAIGIGAALVGSALAPVVSAATMKDNVADITKADVISATGAPVVDVVVGSDAAASDVVWAGNIAARVAQLATTAGSCAGGEAADKSVNFTVGGQTSTSGSGTTAENDMNLQSGGLEANFNPISTTSTTMPALVNNPSWSYKASGVGNSTTAVKEALDANADVFFQDDQGSSRYAPGQLLAQVTASDKAIYTVTISPGYPIIGTTMTNLDANVEVDYTVPLLGKTYVIDRIENSGDKLVLYDQTSPTTLTKDQSIKVTSATDANKQYDLVLFDVVTASAGDAPYIATFNLMDGAVLVDSRDTIVANTDLKDSFGDKFTDSVYVTSVGKSQSTNNVYVSVRTGNTRVEIRDGQAFPYSTNSSTNNKAQWQAQIDRTGGTLNSIQITNKWRYDSINTTTSDTIKNALKVGDEIVWPNNFAKLKFVGMQTKPTTTHTIGNNALTYKDSRGTLIEVPFYSDNQIAKDAYSVVPINSRDFTFHLYDLDSNQDVSSNTRIQYIAGSYDSNANGTWTDVDFNRWTGLSGAINLDIGAESNNSTDSITYKLRVADNTMQDVYLVLAAQAFDLYDQSSAHVGEMYFVGTDSTEDTIVDKTYYEPHVSALGYTNEKAFNVAQFSLREAGSNNGTMANGDVQFNIDTRTDDALNVESVKSDLSNYSRDANYWLWTDSIRDSADYLLTGLTEYGTEISSDNSVFTIVMPTERRKVEMYLGATDQATTVVGGTPFTGVAAGETKSVGSTTVTIDSIAGSCGTGGTAVVISPISGKLVKTDAESSSSKSIIVGGQMVNSAAASAVVDGQSLSDLLVSSGDKVAYVSEVTGDIIVAGYDADDTGAAAQLLISQLESMI